MDLYFNFISNIFIKVLMTSKFKLTSHFLVQVTSKSSCKTYTGNPRFKPQAGHAHWTEGAHHQGVSEGGGSLGVQLHITENLNTSLTTDSNLSDRLDRCREVSSKQMIKVRLQAYMEGQPEAREINVFFYYTYIMSCFIWMENLLCMIETYQTWLQFNWVINETCKWLRYCCRNRRLS